ncbi:hypothetical protein B0H14DRAFT_2192067, partial [Mycena olivaceomarginata]
LPPAALSALIQPGCKYDYMNVLAAAVARITCINPTTLDAYDDALLLVNGMYKPMQIAPRRGLSFDLAVLVRENGIAAALPAAYYRTLVVGNNNSLLLDGLTHQDGTCVSLPPLDLRRCLIGRKRLLVKQFQSGYTLGWLRAWPQSPTCSDAAGCASPYSAASWTTASLWLHKLDKACQMLCGACMKEAAEATATGRRKVWEELP